MPATPTAAAWAAWTCKGSRPKPNWTSGNAICAHAQVALLFWCTGVRCAAVHHTALPCGSMPFAGHPNKHRKLTRLKILLHDRGTRSAEIAFAFSQAAPWRSVPRHSNETAGTRRPSVWDGAGYALCNL